MQMVPILVFIASRIFPRVLDIMRNFTFLLATQDFVVFLLVLVSLVLAFVGISGFLNVLEFWRCKEQTFYCIPRLVLQRCIMCVCERENMTVEMWNT